jgi:hypothetical protein
VVAPYNAHVALIQSSVRRRLGIVARVGTVDRFQGQEAPIAIYSMAASSAEDAPRGMSFLYDGHRLNVAVSRAKGLAIVIASPDLLLVAPRGPEQMRQANAICRLVEVAVEQAGPARDPQERVPIDLSSAALPRPIARPALPPARPVAVADEDELTLGL